MNKLILIALVVVATMAYMEVSFGSRMADDFIRYPDERVRRDIELEELDNASGDPIEASRRTVDRIKRMNREEEVAMYKRFSGGVHPDDEEEDEEEEEAERSIRCITDNVHSIKRRQADGCWWPKCFPHPIKLWLHETCYADIKSEKNFMKVLTYYNVWTMSKFNTNLMKSAADEERADIRIYCKPNNGNYCPIGQSELYKDCNIEPDSRSSIVTARLISHELGHLSGMLHTQTMPECVGVIAVDFNCIIASAAAQYQPIKKDCLPDTHSVAETGTLNWCDIMSFLQYKSHGFLRSGCESNIEVLGMEFSQAVLNIQKEPFGMDIVLLASCGVPAIPWSIWEQRDNCKRGEIYNGEKFMQLEDSIGLPYKALNAGLTKTEQFLHTCDGNKFIVGYECNSGSITIAKQSWDMMDSCSGKKAGYMKIVTGRGCVLGTWSYMCDKERYSDKIGYPLGEDWMIISGECESGYLNLKFKCVEP